MKKIVVYFMFLTFFIVFSVLKAQSFDPEAISQVSKRIAEWKLINKDKGKTQFEQTVYVSSSLSGIVERGISKRISVIGGLAAFNSDYDYWINSEIRQWELNRQINLSNIYMTRLPTNSWVDVAGDITSGTIRKSYQQYMHNWLAVVNVFRNYQNKPALTTFPMSWQVTSATFDIASMGMNTGITFIQTIDRIGISMQVMNPPIYLQNNSKFTSSHKILGIPISGTWKGSGSYNISSGVVNYQETLDTSRSGFIIQTHTDWVITDMGTYYRHIEIKTPANSFERFVVTHYPVGHYFDPTSSTVTTIIIRQQSYRIETIGGISKVTPLPSFRIGNPSINWINIPKITWTIPNTNPFSTYTPSIPKIPIYTPTTPSSYIRKY